MMKQLLQFCLSVVAIIGVSGCAMFRSAPQSEITVTVNDKGYAPATLEATTGTTIRLTLQNVGAQEHQFAIDKIALVVSDSSGSAMAGMDMTGMSNAAADMPQVHLAAAAGQSTTLEFTPAQAGTYVFTCILPDHGERGTLTVKRS